MGPSPIARQQPRVVAFLVVAYCLALAEPTQANYKSQFNPQCLFDRKPSLASLPTVRVYSPKIHHVGNRGCDLNGVDFTLWPLDAQEDQKLAIKQVLLSPENDKLYDPELPTYVLIHGFLAGWNSSDWMCIIKNKILDSGRANVFILDWSGGSKPLLPIDYGQAVRNTELVADLLSVFLESLFDLTAPNNATALHLIGHSLGAHIAGFVGYSFDGSVGEVIALDPAGPCFTSWPQIVDDRFSFGSGFFRPGKATRRLSRASAKSVTALHTDATLFGLNKNCAATDIYVNGGEHQPGGSNTMDITYSHSFAHDILSTYTGNMPDHLCYPVAYLCSSWADYQAGQCGLCPNNDHARCALIGIKLSPTSASQPVIQLPTGLSSTDRMYINLPGQPNSCSFTYQVVLSFGQEVGVGQTFYLEIKQEAGQKRGQIFRISNAIETDSDTHKRLTEEQSYWPKDNTGTDRPLPFARQFYTALLSFEAGDGCRISDTTTTNKSDCIPLTGVKEVRVWAEDSSSELSSLNSVTINYMSGRNHAERMKYSYMIPSQHKFGHVSRERKDVAAPQTTTITTYKNPLNVARAFRGIAEKPIRCLTEFGCPQEDAAKEFERFKYFLRLGPAKLLRNSS